MGRHAPGGRGAAVNVSRGGWGEQAREACGQGQEIAVPEAGVPDQPNADCAGLLLHDLCRVKTFVMLERGVQAADAPAFRRQHGILDPPVNLLHDRMRPAAGAGR